MQRTVLIAASGLGTRLGELTAEVNKALVRVGDKFAICRIIDKHDLTTTRLVITLGYRGHLLREFLDLAYVDNKFEYVYVDNYDGRGASLGYSLLQAELILQCPFLFTCCDSIVLDAIIDPGPVNVLYVSTSQDSNSYATVNVKGDNVMRLNSKGEDTFDFVYTGVSHVHDYAAFWSSLRELYEVDTATTQLSDTHAVSSLLAKGHAFKFIVLKGWHDIGNMSSYKSACAEFKANYNVLFKPDESICFLSDRVIKFFSSEKRLRNRVQRGAALGKHAPKILGFTSHFFSMELVHGDVLSEIRTYGEVRHLLEWANEHFWVQRRISQEYVDVCDGFYRNKTLSRVKAQASRMGDEVGTINGIETDSILSILDSLNWHDLYTDTFCQFHGDFILDNIIKTKDGTFKLIDWREDFGGELMYGDMYYDLAKFRHNLIFNHANIERHLFSLEFENDSAFVDLKCNFGLMRQLDDFETFVVEKGLNLKKIKIITALIWLNMAPLHDFHLGHFLFYFGKFNLCVELASS